MNHSYTSFDLAKENGLIKGNQNYFGIPIKQQISYPASESKGWLTVPAGYIISSATDMGKYLQIYLNGGKDIISTNSIHSMFYDKVKVMKDVYYGMGWGNLSNYSEPVIYHGGLVENYSSVMYLFPKSGIGITLLTNTNDYLVGNKIMDKVFLEILKVYMGEEPDKLNGNSYWVKHLCVDCIYLIFLLFSIIASKFKEGVLAFLLRTQTLVRKR
jgi:CubicO group peptidase (beta-lactamase class C family)